MRLTILFAAMFFASSAVFAQAPELVEDIVVGSQASDPQQLVVFNNKLYFAAKDAGHGRELWEWHQKGTPAVRITDLFAGTNDGMPMPSFNETMYVFNGKLYFYGRTMSGSSLMA